MPNNMNRIYLYACIILLIAGSACRKPATYSSYVYPACKVWAHGVNDTAVARQKAAYFSGMELDLNYSGYQHQLYVGHELYDTIYGLTFEQWMAAIPLPQQHWYWIDMKNLTEDNADTIARLILQVAETYNIKHKIMVEHGDEYALKILKNHGLYVILWVDNTYYSHRTNEQWLKYTRRQTDYLRPDALSCEYRMYPLLPQSFPDYNIHFWDTPKEYNAENVAHTRMLCRDTAVKVVLVDYDRPV